MSTDFKGGGYTDTSRFGGASHTLYRLSSLFQCWTIPSHQHQYNDHHTRAERIFPFHQLLIFHLGTIWTSADGHKNVQFTTKVTIKSSSAVECCRIGGLKGLLCHSVPAAPAVWSPGHFNVLIINAVLALHSQSVLTADLLRNVKTVFF